jgi:hypothetical protein
MLKWPHPYTLYADLAVSASGKGALVCPSCGELHPGKKLRRSFRVFFVAIALLSLLAAAATTLLK